MSKSLSTPCARDDKQIRVGVSDPGYTRLANECTHQGPPPPVALGITSDLKTPRTGLPRHYSDILPAAFLAAHLAFKASDLARLSAAETRLFLRGNVIEPLERWYLAILLRTPARIAARPAVLSFRFRWRP
jgi:hypothetical protein